MMHRLEIDRSRPEAGRDVRRGAAALELALALPLLVTLVLGCVDLGRASAVSMTLSSAAGAGAQCAASRRMTEYTRPSWEAAVRETVIGEMENLSGFAPDLLNCDIAVESHPQEATLITVSLTYPFAMVVDWPLLPKSIVMTRPVTIVQSP